MLQLKSAQFGSRPDFVDVNVRRVWGDTGNMQHDISMKLEKIQQINEQMDDLKLSNPYISLEELRTQYPQLWTLFEEVLEGDWSLNPYQ